VRHRLGLTTRTQISVCKSPFPSAGTATYRVAHQEFSGAGMVVTPGVQWSWNGGHTRSSVELEWWPHQEFSGAGMVVTPGVQWSWNVGDTRSSVELEWWSHGEFSGAGMQQNVVLVLFWKPLWCSGISREAKDDMHLDLQCSTYCLLRHAPMHH